MWVLDAWDGPDIGWLYEVAVKQCTTCLRTLPLNDFSPDKRNQDGKQGRCRDCCREANRECIRRRRQFAKPCPVPGCPNVEVSGGLCRAHRSRRERAKGDYDAMTDTRPVAPYGTIGCSVKGCDDPHTARGLCSSHYSRHVRGTPVENLLVKRDRRIRDPADPDTWSRSLTPAGYVMLTYTSRGKQESIFEHRHVIQKSLARDLTPDENVHHINGVRDDNRIENLELWSTSQPAGQRVVDKVEWAKEILLRYEPSALA